MQATTHAGTHKLRKLYTYNRTSFAQTDIKVAQMYVDEGEYTAAVNAELGDGQTLCSFSKCML